MSEIRPEFEDENSKHSYISTPQSQRLSDYQEGRTDVQEEYEKLKDIGYSDEELAGQNPFFDGIKPIDTLRQPGDNSDGGLSDIEVYGMTIEAARENPKMLLDQIERLIIAFENEEVVPGPEQNNIFQDAKMRLLALMVLARRIEDSIYKSGLKGRHEELRSRMEKIRTSF